MGSGAPNYVDNAIWRLLSLQCPAMWLGCPIGAGLVYWVDAVNGLNTNIGTRPDQPFQTIEEALANHCVANRNDYIIVLRSNLGAAETFPISVDIVRVHIIGLPGSNWGFNGMYTKLAADANAVFQIGVAAPNDGNFAEIAGFDIGADAVPALQLGDVEGVWIHDCWFGNKEKLVVEPTYGILNGGHAPKCRIDHCKFLGSGGHTNGGISVDGICSIGAATLLEHSEILDNIFQGCPGRAINLDYAVGVTIKHNEIALDDDTQGAGITLDTNSEGNLVTDNRAQFGHDAMANNPYLDLASTPATPDMNHWTYNWAGNLVRYPD